MDVKTVSEHPPGLDAALTTLEKVVRLVLQRLPAAIDPRCALAFARASWWDEGEAAGLLQRHGFLFAPTPAKWPEGVNTHKAEMERELEESPYLRIFRRGDLATSAFGQLLTNEVTSHDRAGGTQSFVGRSFRVGAYDLVPIVEFDGDAYRRHPAVSAPSARVASETLTVGLLDAAIRSTLGWYADEIATGLHDRHYAFRADVDSIVRGAATIMFSDLRRIMNADLGAAELFQALDSISALRHERAECRASILFAASQAIESLRPVHFQEAVSLHEAMWARKVLEMAVPPFAAASDGDSLIGLVQPAPADSNGRQFTVSFAGHHHWTLSAGPKRLAEFRLGLPSYAAEPLGRERFRDSFERVFPGPAANLEKLWPVVHAVITSDHGALVVVTDDAAQEAERLSGQSSRIVPTELSSEQASRLSRIDGALLIDPAGTCHAVGVILDGQAVDAGSRSRGARFNSAIRYVNGGASRLAVVHSEDGHVDLLPRLRPRVKKSELQSDLSTLRTAAPESVDRRAFKLMAERIALYVGELEINEDDWNKVVRFLMHDYSFFEERRPVPEYDPHPSDFLPES